MLEWSCEPLASICQGSCVPACSRVALGSFLAGSCRKASVFQLPAQTCHREEMQSVARVFGGAEQTETAAFTDQCELFGQLYVAQ